MVETTTIRVDDETKALLDKVKIHPRETYNDILVRILIDETKADAEAIQDGTGRKK